MEYSIEMLEELYKTTYEHLNAAREDTERERYRAVKAECKAARLRKYLAAAEQRDTNAVKALLDCRRERDELASLLNAGSALIEELRQELAEAKK